MNAAALPLVLALAALGAAGGIGVAATSLIGCLLVFFIRGAVPRPMALLAAAAFGGAAVNGVLFSDAGAIAPPNGLVWAPAVGAGTFVLARLGRTHLLEGLVDGLLAVLAVVVILGEPSGTDALPTSTIFMLGELTYILAVWGRVAFTRRGLPASGSILFGALALAAMGTAMQIIDPDHSILLVGALLGASRGLAVVGLLHPSFPKLLTPSIDRPRALPRTLVLLSVTTFVGALLAVRVAPSDVLGLTTGVLVLLLTATLATRVAVALIGQRAAEAELYERRSRDTATGLLTSNHMGSAYVDIDGREHDHLVLLRVEGLRQTLRSLPPAPAAELTRELARRTMALAPDGAKVARGDEDELLVLTTADATLPAERILTALRSPIELTTSGATVSVEAVGAVVTLAATTTFALAFEQARYAASRAAVAGGRGGPLPYDGDVEADRARSAAIIDALPAAISGGAIVPFFQPIVEVTTGRVLGFETLARWTDATLGPVGPVEFIPLAEATGAIAQLGRGLTEQACTQLGRWRHLPGHAELYVSVNLSPRQLTEDLDVWLAEAIAAADIAPHSLLLEITEGVLIEGTPGVDVPGVLDRVRALGVRIAIDDFGTGYSSLAYLQRFRPDVVKIDRSFTQRLGTADGDVASGVFAMLDGLGWDVVAEGIETAETAAALTELACHAGQGWLWSAAVDVDAATDLLVDSPASTTTPEPRTATSPRDIRELDGGDATTMGRDVTDVTDVAKDQTPRPLMSSVGAAADSASVAARAPAIAAAAASSVEV